MSGRRPREVKIDFRSNPRWRSCRHWNLLNRYKLNCGLCDVVKVSHYVPGGRWAGWASSSGNASLIATFLVIFDITSSVRLSCVCQLANARYILAYLYLIIIIIIIYNVVTLSTTFAACMSRQCYKLEHHGSCSYILQSLAAEIWRQEHKFIIYSVIPSSTSCNHNKKEL